MCHDQWLIRENITQLRMLMSDQNLQLLPDYEQRIQVLRDLSFIDDASRVQLKGKVACEIHSADELVLTELILENVLAAYEPAEIVALLSCFVFQEKTDTVPNLTSSLERGMKNIIDISEKVNHIQTLHQVILSSEDSNDFVSRPRFGLMEVVYEWARGMSFRNIMALTDVLEGTIVRVITRLDETCREVRGAARIIGDPELFAKMEKCKELIKRDITAVASLYMVCSLLPHFNFRLLPHVLGSCVVFKTEQMLTFSFCSEIDEEKRSMIYDHELFVFLTSNKTKLSWYEVRKQPR